MLNPHCPVCPERSRRGGAWGYITDTPGSGLLQLGARFYWPELGRFITQDPVGDGMNWYGYVGSNPVVYVDPEGYSAGAIAIELGGAGVGIGLAAVLAPEVVIPAVAIGAFVAVVWPYQSELAGPTVCPANRYRHPGRPQRPPRQIGPEEARPKPPTSKKPPKPPTWPYGPDSPGRELPPYNRWAPRPFTEPPPGIGNASPLSAGMSRADMARKLGY